MTPLDVLHRTFSETPSDTFPDALGRDLIHVLADLSARLEAQDNLITSLGARVEELEERLAMAAAALDPDRDEDSGSFADLDS